MPTEAVEAPVQTLIVDDVAKLRTLVADALADTPNFEVVGQAADGREAIEQTLDLEPDLVLLDLSMPRMDGLEALTEIRRQIPGTEIVVLSGFTSERMEALVEDHGALAYIEKGIEPEALVERLSTFVSGLPDGGDGASEASPEPAELTHIHIVTLDQRAGKQVASALRSARPGWRFSSGPVHGGALAGSVDAIVAAVGDCSGGCSDTLHSLVARYPETPTVVAVRGLPEDCLQAAREAGVTDVADLDIVDGEQLVDRIRWASLVERRRRSQTRGLEMLAGTMAHDLRSPLRAIDRYTDWVEEGIAEGDQGRIDQALDGLDRGVERARRLIDAQLTYARVQTRPPAPGETDPREPLAEVLEELEQAIARAEATVEIGALPTVLVPSEPLLVLFRNLLSNAIKYREEGQPPTVQVDGEDADGEAVLRVSDDGIGIDPDHQEEIFDPFTRLHAEQDYPGTGLGLAICQRIVEQWGGSIAVDSAPGEGTTVQVRLPRPSSG